MRKAHTQAAVNREAGLTVVEMTIVLLMVIILATLVVTPALKLGATSRIRSGGMSAFSMVRGARSRAITEGVSVHVRYYNSPNGPQMEAVRVNPQQAGRFTSPDWTDAGNERLASVMLDESLEWSSEAYLYFRPDGSTPASVTLRLRDRRENARYMELAVYAGSGIVETGRLNYE